MSASAVVVRTSPAATVTSSEPWPGRPGRGVGSTSYITDGSKEVDEDKKNLDKEDYMPSETTAQVGEDFTHYITYSWSECGNYDDQTGYSTCNRCGATVADEYGYAEEDELNFHREGKCVIRNSARLAAVAIAQKNRLLYGVCEWCQKRPCDCPF